MKKKITTFVLGLGSLVLSACTQGVFFAANLPQYASDIQVVESIAYGDQPIQRLDIYIPDMQADNYPVVVFLHGGRWTDGNKDQYRFMGLKMAENGYVTVIPDYSKYPDVKFPAFVEDAAKAVAWTHDNIMDYQGNTDQMYLFGHSSGAHMGGLIAADETYLTANGKTRDIIRGFAGLAGPYAFTPEDKDLKDIFGPPEKYPQMRTSNFIDGNQPPMLLIHGQDDDLVSTQNAYAVKREIDAKGGEIIVREYDGYDHTDLVKDFTWIGPDDSVIVRDVLSFFK